MLPNLIYEKISGDSILNASYGIDETRIFEVQSIDQRPVNNGYFIAINWQESTDYLNHSFAPRIMTLWVHSPMDTTRDYRQIDKILNRVDDVLLAIEQESGNDGTRVTCVLRSGRSGNLIDDGWKTIARNATYRVLYDEKAA